MYNCVIARIGLFVKDIDKIFVKAKMSKINPLSLNNQFVIVLRA